MTFTNVRIYSYCPTTLEVAFHMMGRIKKEAAIGTGEMKNTDLYIGLR